MKLPWKFTKKKPLTPWEEAIELVCKKWKRYERKRKYYKIYLFVFFLLPIFASILTVKVVKTYVRIKLRQVAAKVPGTSQEAAAPSEEAAAETDAVSEESQA